MININNSIKAISELYSEGKFSIEFKDCIIKESDINNDYFSNLGNKVHIDLPAVPYMGDVRNAKWYLLMTNPGFEYMEYKEKKDSSYYKAMEKNLKQDLDEDYPCVWFNPEFYWTSGFNYWANLLCKPQITLEKLKWLSSNVAIIQMFGYYSSNNEPGFENTRFREYNSKAAELVKHISSCPDKEIVISRNSAGWKRILDEEDKEIYKNIKDRELIKPCKSGRHPFIPKDLLDEVN
ncbi:MAG: hypothetical protein K2X04_07105 [Burkholderiales bacterium]|nr:hypothetical protein [Burkholderiales bacterium]